MPKGQPKDGRRKISGDVSPQVFEELLRFQQEKDLPSLHRTVSIIVEGWAQNRLNGPQDSHEPTEGSS